MSKPDDFDNEDPQSPPPFDLSRYRSVPRNLIVVGAIVAAIGAFFSFTNQQDGGRQFGYAYLVAFMFCLSIGVGSFFLVLAHHLFDAGWSVATRRFCEHLSTILFPTCFVLWLPLGLLAPKLYAWMGPTAGATAGHLHALHAKYPLFTTPGFYIVSIACFLIWGFVTNRLKFWSLEQDKDGAARCTYKLRMWASLGIVLFAFSVTFAVIMWMKALHHQWFSTMYAVCYFAGSVWMTLALVYVITMVLDRQRILSDVLHEHQYYFLGSLMFAFTVFYAYVTFAQYFIIWNANMPEETFYFIIRERGIWFWVSMVIIFGHFFLPFLSLLRIDVKHTFGLMVPLAIWAWLMHFADMAFQVWPYHYNTGFFPLQWGVVALGCLALMLGVIATVFLKKFASTPPYPIKDPRLSEAMGLYHPVATPISGGDMDEADDSHGALRPKGGH
jgi:hypothetical protein